ncbi:MAG: ABC transporter permease [Pseudomonadota bacterium]
MLKPERGSAKPSAANATDPTRAGRSNGRGSPQSEPIVPKRSIAGSALMLVIAIMGCLACLAVGAVTLVDRAASEWRSDIARELTIEVVSVDEDVTDERLVRTAEIARAAPGIGSVSVVDEAETRALLEPWLGILGSEGALETLPIPRLVTLIISDINALDLDALQRTLDREVPGATVDDHRVWTDQLSRMAGAMVVGGLGILTLVLTATILCVIFATRAAMAGNKDVVDVLHFVGASHGFIAGEFQRHFLMLGMRGGLIGGASAIFLFLVLQLWVTARQGSADADQVEALMGSPALGLEGYVGCLVVVLLIAFLTAATSRMTVSRFLKGR